MTEREAFLAALAENEDDTVTRLVFADWLDENDQPEEADRMRRWAASKAWLTDWVRSINYGKWEYDEDGGYARDAAGDRIPAKKDNLGDPHTYEDVIRAGDIVVGGGTFVWRTDAGQDYFFSNDYAPLAERVREWLGHWSTVTGVRVPDLDIERFAEKPPFRCGC